MKKRDYAKDKRRGELELILEMLVRRVSVAADLVSLSDKPTTENLTLAVGEIRGLARSMEECQIELANLSWEGHDPVCSTGDRT